MNTIDEAIEILQAMKEGKKIEAYYEDRWQDSKLKTSVPNFSLLTYRIKPEPREVWVNVYPCNHIGGAHTTKEEAEEICDEGGRTARFREVIEE